MVPADVRCYSSSDSSPELTHGRANRSSHRSEEGDTQEGHRHREQRNAEVHDQVDLESELHDRAGARQNDLDLPKIAIFMISPARAFGHRDSPIDTGITT